MTVLLNVSKLYILWLEMAETKLTPGGNVSVKITSVVNTSPMAEVGCGVGVGSSGGPCPWTELIARNTRPNPKAKVMTNRRFLIALPHVVVIQKENPSG
jgi:hypothetical protein